VTGIINTFKLITVHGSGDVKMLSSGISEALITTEFGLIVAIPSLLLHAFLSRKARGMIDRMEKAAISFVNQISKTPYRRDNNQDLFSRMPAAQAREFLRSLMQQGESQGGLGRRAYSLDSAGGLMDPTVISVGKTATVAEAIEWLRNAGMDDDVNTLFVVDERGRYVGDIHIRHLLTRPEHTRVESLVNMDARFVRVDTHRDEVLDLFHQYGLTTLPVLDHDDQLVGRIMSNGNGDIK
jgi:Mg/Co/Ni transporter MgtE